ncbi:MAG: beta-lactamase family protein [Oscillospiraceae bacterium]|nr:beta-lactamase family protein [Oscillospiraceae bacterium]
MKKLLCVLLIFTVMVALTIPAAALTPQQAFNAVNRSPLGGDGFSIADSYAGGNFLGGYWVWQNGRVVQYEYRRGYCIDTPHQFWSGTKPMLSVLTGIAIHHGYIESVEQYAIDFFPDAVIRRGQERKRDITVFHLLTLRSGLPSMLHDRGALRPLFVRYDAGLAAFMAPQINRPGTFRYCQGGPATQALVGVIERATGQNLYDFARQYLFNPLNMNSISWTRTQSGSPVGGFGLYISPRDLFAFGQLHLQDGVWNGRRLLPRGWVEALTPASEQVERYSSNGRHRLYFVSDTDAGWQIRASGMGGNHLNILIEHNTMVVRIGHKLGYQSVIDWAFSNSGLMRQRCWLYLR